MKIVNEINRLKKQATQDVVNCLVSKGYSDREIAEIFQHLPKTRQQIFNIRTGRIDD